MEKEIKNTQNCTHFHTRIDEIEIKINKSTEHSRIIAELCNDGSNELASKICNESKKVLRISFNFFLSEWVRNFIDCQ